MMDTICHKKIMERLDNLEGKINRMNAFYAQKCIIINREFMEKSCIVLLGLGTFALLYFAL
jgi:hypothetical protein